MNPYQEALQVLQLAAATEPIVLKFILSLMEKAQGKTGDQFFAEADVIWDAAEAKTKAELGL